MVSAPPASAEGPDLAGSPVLDLFAIRKNKKGTNVRVSFSGPPGVEGGRLVFRLDAFPHFPLASLVLEKIYQAEDCQ